MHCKAPSWTLQVLSFNLSHISPHTSAWYRSATHTNTHLFLYNGLKSIRMDVSIFLWLYWFWKRVFQYASHLTLCLQILGPSFSHDLKRTQQNFGPQLSFLHVFFVVVVALRWTGTRGLILRTTKKKLWYLLKFNRSAVHHRNKTRRDRGNERYTFSSGNIGTPQKTPKIIIMLWRVHKIVN